MSLAKTLAGKLRISVPQVFERYKTTIQTERGPRKVLMVKEAQPGKEPLVTYWGGVSLARDNTATLIDQHPSIINGRTELVQRLLADTCELCGSMVKVQVHHIRALKDLRKKGRAETARLGGDDGPAASQDAGGLCALPRGHPRRASVATRRKYRICTQRRRIRHWRAGCGESRTSGSEGGRRKSAPVTRSNSPAAYLTQNETARRAGISPSLLSQIMNGRRTPRGTCSGGCMGCCSRRPARNWWRR